MMGYYMRFVTRPISYTLALKVCQANVPLALRKSNTSARIVINSPLVPGDREFDAGVHRST
jgi:hypothetical protein